MSWPELLFREGEPSAVIREAAFQTNLARVLADPACPFCTAEMVDGRCPDCGHDPSTRGEPSAVNDRAPAGAHAEHPTYDRIHLPRSGWRWWRKRRATAMVQLGGPCTIVTIDGPVTLPVGWRGYLAIDEAGHPYPVTDSVHRASYEPAGEPHV